jgi:hypothetical protein
MIHKSETHPVQKGQEVGLLHNNIVRLKKHCEMRISYIVVKNPYCFIMKHYEGLSIHTTRAFIMSLLSTKNNEEHPVNLIFKKGHLNNLFELNRIHNNKGHENIS